MMLGSAGFAFENRLELIHTLIKVQFGVESFHAKRKMLSLVQYHSKRNPDVYTEVKGKTPGYVDFLFYVSRKLTCSGYDDNNQLPLFGSTV